MVVETANAIPSNTVVEVGCGLGEIIYRINAPKKFGIDNNANVIKAASFLHGSKVEFRVGSLDAVLQVGEPVVDILIMVNWLHDVDSKQITGWMRGLLESKRVRFILVDEIHHDRVGYRYKHNFEDYFSGAAKKIKEIHDGGEGTRKLVLLEVT